MNKKTISRESLLGMMQAYKTTSLLRTGVSMGVFDCLAEGPVDAETAAGRLGSHPRGMRILLNALAAVGLVEERAGGSGCPRGRSSSS